MGFISKYFIFIGILLHSEFKKVIVQVLCSRLLCVTRIMYHVLAALSDQWVHKQYQKNSRNQRNKLRFKHDHPFSG